MDYGALLDEDAPAPRPKRAPPAGDAPPKPKHARAPRPAADANPQPATVAAPPPDETAALRAELDALRAQLAVLTAAGADLAALKAQVAALAAAPAAGVGPAEIDACYQWALSSPQAAGGVAGSLINRARRWKRPEFLRQGLLVYALWVALGRPGPPTTP